MTDRKRERVTGREALDEIDRRLGGLFGSLTQELGRIVEAAEAAGKDGRGPMKVESSVSIRVGGLDVGREAAGTGRDTARPVNPARRKPPAAEDRPATGAREPIFEVFEEDGYWTLTAELPGISEDDLSISAADGVLRLRTTGARRYAAEVPLPAGISAGGLETHLTNGFLEIRAPKPGSERQ